MEGIFLLSAAVGMYLRPLKSSYRTLLSDVVKSRVHSVLFFLFMGLTIFADLYYALFRPYTVALVESISGNLVFSLKVAIESLTDIGALFGFFLAHPIILLVLGIRKIPSRKLRASLITLPVRLDLGGYDLSRVHAVRLGLGLDASPIMYVLLAVIFSVTTRGFRRAALLAGFVEMAPKATGAASPVRSGQRVESISGKKALLEVDPSSQFEETIRDICKECIDAKRTVFVFTPQASRLYNAVSQIADVRLYTMSSDATYLKPTERLNEVQIPKYDVPVLLDTLDRTVATTAGQEIVVVFDSISDMILSSDFDQCYKFLKQANEINIEPRVSALFIMLKGVHKENTVKVMKSLFQSHFIIESSELKVEK
jgi:ssDNA-specific exonuclease RecJ